MDKNIKDTYWAFLHKYTYTPKKTNNGWQWKVGIGFEGIDDTIWWHKYLI